MEAGALHYAEKGYCETGMRTDHMNYFKTGYFIHARVAI